MLVPLNKETVAMLVSQTDRQGIEFYLYAKFFFCSLLKSMAADYMSENQQYWSENNSTNFIMSVALGKSESDNCKMQG